MVKDWAKSGLGVALAAIILTATADQDRLLELSLQELPEAPVNTASVQALSVKHQAATMPLISRQDTTYWMTAFCLINPISVTAALALVTRDASGCLRNGAGSNMC